MRTLHSDDLLDVLESFLLKLEGLEKKLCNDSIINQGLFLMMTSYFEDSIRELIKVVLAAYPEKLTKDSYSVSREQICAIADKGHMPIIDNELYFLFKDGVRSQLEKLFKILLNKEYKKNDGKNSISREEKESIIKLSEISLYRNALVHNGGRVSIEINDKVRYFRPSGENLKFDSELIRIFISEYEKFFEGLDKHIKKVYYPRKRISVIESAEDLWKDCFASPILNFRDYWHVDEKNDRITGIKYPEVERGISNSEKVLLSIWRHQFDDSNKTEEFLLCSVDYHKIYMLYRGLDSLKFYHMQQYANE